MTTDDSDRGAPELDLAVAAAFANGKVKRIRLFDGPNEVLNYHTLPKRKPRKFRWPNAATEIFGPNMLPSLLGTISNRFAINKIDQFEEGLQNPHFCIRDHESERGRRAGDR